MWNRGWWITCCLLTGAGSAWAQERAASGVRDGGRLFDAAVVREVDSALDRLSRRHGLPIVIETIEALPDGGTIDEEAKRRQTREAPTALYLLTARREGRTSDVQLPPRANGAIPAARLQAIRDSFTEDFRQRRFDDGLRKAAATVETALVGVQLGGPDLVLRDQVRLNLAGARAVLAAAEARASELGLKMNIAIVDDGGHLLAFGRMDGARPASGPTAITKATTAATFRAATGPLPATGGTTPDLLLNLSLQNAAAASGGKLTTLLGGVPIVVDGQVIGAIGVGGGSGEQDTDVAKTGVAALLRQLKP